MQTVPYFPKSSNSVNPRHLFSSESFSCFWCIPRSPCLWMTWPLTWCPETLARVGLELYIDLKNQVESLLKLRISVKKSGFLVSHKQVQRELQKQMVHCPTVVFPSVHYSMKDLGLQSTLGKARRVGVAAARPRKGLGRASRLATLPKRTRLQLFAGNIHPTAMWGSQALGVATSTLQQYRVQVAKRAGFRKPLGCLMVAHRLFMDEHVDPQHSVIEVQLSTWLKIVRDVKPEVLPTLNKAWMLHADKILNSSKHWLYGRGPLTATLCVLKDLGWSVRALDDWRDPHDVRWDPSARLVTVPACCKLCECNKSTVCGFKHRAIKVVVVLLMEVISLFLASN